MKLVDWALSHSAEFVDIEQRAAAMYADHPTSAGHGELIIWGFKHRADEAALFGDIQKLLSDFPGFTLSATPDAETLGDELAKALEAKHAGDPHSLAAIDVGGIIAAFQKWWPIILDLIKTFKGG